MPLFLPEKFRWKVKWKIQKFRNEVILEGFKSQKWGEKIVKDCPISTLDFQCVTMSIDSCLKNLYFISGFVLCIVKYTHLCIRHGVQTSRLSIWHQSPEPVRLLQYIISYFWPSIIVRSLDLQASDMRGCGWDSCSLLSLVLVSCTSFDLSLLFLFFSFPFVFHVMVLAISFYWIFLSIFHIWSFCWVSLQSSIILSDQVVSIF